jgi:hypothetical protein
VPVAPMLLRFIPNHQPKARPIVASTAKPMAVPMQRHAGKPAVLSKSNVRTVPLATAMPSSMQDRNHGPRHCHLTN